jgi:glycosyl transferase family 87
MDCGTLQDRNDPLKKALTHCLALWSVVAPLWVLVNSALGGKFALDFRHAFLPAAHAVLQGDSPYSAIGSRALSEGTAFLYPPIGAYLLAPFTLFPPVVAETIAVVLAAAGLPVTLRLLGVRDWRCYAIGFLWWPTIIAVQTGNLTLPMLLGVALLWRYRDRPVVAALVAGLVVALKLFFWPLLVWLVATRRYRTAALAAVATSLLVVAPWAGIGFAGLRGYPHLLSTVSSSEGPRSYAVAALAHSVLSSWTAAVAVETAIGAALLLLVLAAGRRGRDRDAFALSIVALLVLTPLLEMHYLAALLVLVALYRKELGVAWVAPLLIWGAPATVAGSTIQVVHVLVVGAATVALALSDRPWRFVRSFRRPAERLAPPMRRGAGLPLAPP